MINRIERPLANDHPDGSFSVHLFLHRPKTQNSRIIGQYTHNLLGLKTLSFALLLSSTKIWIKGPQIGSDMPSALGLVYLIVWLPMIIILRARTMTIWLELRQQFGRGGGGARICWRALKVTAPTLALPNATEHINAYYNGRLNCI